LVPFASKMAYIVDSPSFSGYLVIEFLNICLFSVGC
jgi:hypothetical protein